MIRKIAPLVWAVSAADPSIPHFGMRPEETMEVHGYVEWVSNRFVIYFSHITHQTPERERRDLEPTIYPIPMTDYTYKAASVAIMAEFWPMLWDQTVRPAAELADRLRRDELRGVARPAQASDPEADEAMKELQDAINSIDDEGNVIEPGTDGDQ